MMKALQGTSFLGGGNAAYLEAQYESWLEDPSSVVEHWRNYFEQLPVVNGVAQDTAHSKIREQFYQIAKQSRSGLATPAVDANLDHERKQVRVQQLINAYRMRGHQWAHIDPLEDDHSERTPGA